MDLSAGRKNADFSFLHDMPASYKRQQNDFRYYSFPSGGNKWLYIACSKKNSGHFPPGGITEDRPGLLDRSMIWSVVRDMKSYIVCIGKRMIPSDRFRRAEINHG